METLYSWTFSSCLIQVLSLTLLLLPLVSEAYEVIYAVNCGGSKHTDRFGIPYETDNSNDGIASDYGKNLIISRVHPDDMILYQTERYHTTSFSYKVSVPEDGEYYLILKFAEVYFQQPQGKVFDVVLNKQHIAIKELDIFAKVGKAVAHDEVIPFSVEGDQFFLGEESSDFDGTLAVEFSKGYADNPKINAIVVIKGPVEESEMPALRPVEIPEDDLHQDDQDTEWSEPTKDQKFKKTSGPKTIDPYASDESWFMPITIAIAVFLPVLFCLCRVR